jgi:hypothetical protein
MRLSTRAHTSFGAGPSRSKQALSTHTPLKTLQCQGSRDGYIGLWMRFFCYVFRVWATPSNVQAEIYGLELS